MNSDSGSKIVYEDLLNKTSNPRLTPKDAENIQALAKFLNAKRLKMKYSKRALANEVKMSRDTIQLIMEGKRNPTFTSLLRIFKALEIELTMKDKHNETRTARDSDQKNDAIKINADRDCNQRITRRSS